MLKKKIDKEAFDALPEAIQSEYIESDDGYVLEVDDTEAQATKTKLEEFRKNNVTLMKEVEAIKNSLKEKEEALKKIADDEQKKKEKKMLADDDIDGLVAEKTKRMKQDLQNQIEALSAKLSDAESLVVKYKGSLSQVKIDNAIQLEVSKVGTVRKGYMEDIIALGKRIFSMGDNDEPVAVDSKGGTIVGKDGVSPLTIAEWAQALPAEKSAYFEGSQGGGSQGNANRGKRSGVKLAEIADPVERIKAARKSGKTA